MIPRKTKLIFTLILLSIGLHAQRTTSVKGSVVDTLSNPVPFSTIAVLGESTKGTYADIEGNFILELQDFPALLKISNVGYKTKQILLKAPSDDVLIVLQQKEIVLDEVLVTNKKLKSKTIGSPKSRKGILSFTVKKPFEQLGVMVENKDGHLYSNPRWLSVYIKIGAGGAFGFGNKPTGNDQLRLRLYKIDNDRKVGEDILVNNVFLSPTKGGWYQVDISRLNLALPPEGFVIAVEWLSNQPVREWVAKKHTAMNYGVEILGHRLSSEEKKYYSTYRFKSLSTGWEKPSHIAERDLHIPCFRLEFY